MLLDQGRIIEFDRWVELPGDDELINPIMFADLPPCCETRTPSSIRYAKQREKRNSRCWKNWPESRYRWAYCIPSYLYSYLSSILQYQFDHENNATQAHPCRVIVQSLIIRFLYSWLPGSASPCCVWLICTSPLGGCMEVETTTLCQYFLHSVCC